MYGTGSGVFFLGYALFQVGPGRKLPCVRAPFPPDPLARWEAPPLPPQLPSNLLLRRVGAPRWLALLCAAWGVAAAACAGLTGSRAQVGRGAGGAGGQDSAGEGPLR